MGTNAGLNGQQIPASGFWKFQKGLHSFSLISLKLSQCGKRDHQWTARIREGVQQLVQNFRITKKKKSKLFSNPSRFSIIKWKSNKRIRIFIFNYPNFARILMSRCITYSYIWSVFSSSLFLWRKKKAEKMTKWDKAEIFLPFISLNFRYLFYLKTQFSNINSNIIFSGRHSNSKNVSS